MRCASIAALKARLSEYVNAVKAREEIIVTDRNRPVAWFIDVGPSAQRDARLDSLIRAGLARPAESPLSRKFWGARHPQDPRGRALGALMEEREGAPKFLSHRAGPGALLAAAGGRTVRV